MNAWEKVCETQKSAIESALDTYRDAVRRTRAKEIDAAACQTRRDRQAADIAEQDEDKALEALLEVLAVALDDAKRDGAILLRSRIVELVRLARVEE